MTGFDEITGAAKSHDHTSREFYQQATAPRVSTEIAIITALRRQYPDLQITTTNVYNSPLLAYAAAGFATVEPVEDPHDIYGQQLKSRWYTPPAKRTNGGSGHIYEVIEFGKFLYRYKDSEFVLYVVNGRDGTSAYPEVINNHILSNEENVVNELIAACYTWSTALHDEIWIFDGGYWRKDRDLWQSVQKASWANVILPQEMKESIINDVEGFFDSEDVYKKLQVPWKRGIIYYGPPGNGKTISIKATMKSLMDQKEAIPSLYVRSLASFGGPEFSISQIFSKARHEAPCYLIFEDLDSLVSDEVRSYFLNEVDGLAQNDGILMVGSTNHLERLDDGIAKRPSRFDRKYNFPNPDEGSREVYAKFWQKKLSSNTDVEFPDSMCPAIAKITGGFSFAYMQEAFVAALLVLAHRGNKKDGARMDGGGDGDDYEDLPLWKELKKQIALLREGIESASEAKPQQERAPRVVSRPILPPPALRAPLSTLQGQGQEQSQREFGGAVPSELDAFLARAMSGLDQTFGRRYG